MRDRLDAVRARIAAAARRAGRDPTAVRLVAVTKGQPAEAIRNAVAAGIVDIGENRVQEARAKRDEIDDPGIRWHLLGHLQQNKAATAARLFDTVHSVDSERIAVALARRRTPSAPLTALIEVDLTGIAGRTGVAPELADTLLTALLPLQGPLRIDGLMTVAPPGSADAARACFAGLRALRDDLAARHGLPLAELSMGMSADFEIAVEEGATTVRLGRILFGDRPPVS